MRNTRHQPLTVNGNNINALRAKIYNMFASLVPSSNYTFHGNGKVAMWSLPFYQAGGCVSTGRMFLQKERSFTDDEKLAFEIIAASLKDEGVEVIKEKNGTVKGLRLKYKPTSKKAPKATSSYKIEDNIKDVVQTELPLVSAEFDPKEMYVVIKNNSMIRFILSKQEIEKSIIEDKYFAPNVTIYKIGERVEPKLMVAL